MWKILLIEDYRPAIEGFKRFFKFDAEVLTAETADEAEKLIRKHLVTANIVVLDACLGSAVPNTIPLIKLVKEIDQHKIIVACSGDPDNNVRLVNAGATFQVDKPLVTNFVLQILQSTIEKI